MGSGFNWLVRGWVSIAALHWVLGVGVARAHTRPSQLAYHPNAKLPGPIHPNPSPPRPPSFTPPCPHLEDESLLAAVGHGELDLAVQAARAQQGRVQRVGAVGGHDDLCGGGGVTFMID